MLRTVLARRKLSGREGERERERAARATKHTWHAAQAARRSGVLDGQAGGLAGAPGRAGRPNAPVGARDGLESSQPGRALWAGGTGQPIYTSLSPSFLPPAILPYGHAEIMPRIMYN